jgi:predicted O-linked N-acetylglucosamine transferase (SPINDLY family)
MPEHAVDQTLQAAVAQYQAGNPRAAEKLCRQILSRQPNNVDALNLLGGCLYQTGDLNEAIEVYQRIAALKPDLPEAHNNLGGCLQRNGRMVDAIAAYKTAMRLKGDFPEAKSNLATAYFGWGKTLLAGRQTAEALEAFQQAVAFKGDFIDALVKVGECLQTLEKFDGAAAAYETIIRLKPDMFEAFNNLGIALQALGRIEEAIAAFKKAVEITPHSVDAVSNFATALIDAGRPEEALAWRLRAIEIDPSSRVAHQDLGLLLLLLGQFERGWREFEYRRDLQTVESKFRPMAPRWDGRDPAGKTIFIAHEQGFGDMIQFVRYLPLVAQKGAKVLLECPVELRRLLDGSPSYHLVLDGDPRPDFDFYCPLMSLAMILGTTLRTIPADVPYLHASPELVKVWRDRLGPGGEGLRVGIAWAGSPNFARDRTRSTSLDRLAPLAQVHDATFYSLQKDDAAAQADHPPAGLRLVNLSPELHDFADTAAVICLMDLVITTDTSVAHLAGALGRPVWVMLQFAADWRWLLGRDDSPWYPTMRLFRQRAAGDWLEVFQRAARELGAIRPSASRPLQSGPEMFRAKIKQMFESAVPLHRDGNLDAAEAVYQSILDEFPNQPDALHLLGVVANQRGQNHKAVGLIQHAIDLNPNNPDYFVNLAVVWFALRRYALSAEASRAALRLDPKNAGAHRNLGMALCKSGDLEAAAKATQTAIDLDPSDFDAYGNLGVVLAHLGDRPAAITAYRKALELHPQAPSMHSNLIFAMQQHGDYDPKAIYAESRNWNRLHALPLKHLIKPHRVDSSPGRKLRIGWVSPDFRMHVVARCLLPVFQAFDRARFENFCYAEVGEPDEMTRALRASVDHWRDIYPLEDEEAADLIRADGIDILIDLALHTTNSRLTMFALKPAPVQACYLGYCGSTGLDAMDYRISQAQLDPPGADLSVYSEQTVLLSGSYLCYRPEGPTPDVAALPAIQNGHVTFGCLHQPAKISAGVIDLWSQLLGAVPESRLILYVPPGSHRQWLLDRFTQLGVDSNRLEMLPRRLWRQYIETFNRIDIALDTFPYGGGVSACDALWMGVPIVTLIGNTPVGRICYSMLCNLGRREWAAQTPAQYLAVAAALAADLPKLREIRTSLRAAMESSPIMDAASIARDLQDLFTGIFLNTLAGPKAPADAHG